MNKKTLLSTISAFAIVLALGSCGHEHTFASEWSKDETNHWHAATCEHKEEVSDKAAHSWDAGQVTLEATEEAEGTKTYTCTVCEATKTEPIAKLEHSHKFATEWSKDETHHWHASTCGHAEEVSDKAEHSWGEEQVIEAPTYSQAGKSSYSCTTCGYSKEVEVGMLEPLHVSNASDLEQGTIEQSITDGGFTYKVAVDGADVADGKSLLMVVEALETPVEMDGLVFTSRLKSDGSTQKTKSGETGRAIEFTTTGAGKLVVYAKSGSTSEERKAILVDLEKGAKHGELTALTDTISKFELDFHYAGTYQLQFLANISVYHLEAAWVDGSGDPNWKPQVELANPNILDVSELGAATLDASVTYGQFTINALPDEGDIKKTIVIESNSKKYDGVNYTQRLKFGGEGTVDYRSITVTTSGAARITVVALSSSSSANRVGKLVNATTLEEIGTHEFAGKVSGTNTLDAGVFSVSEAGSYCFMAVGGGINVYAIIVEPQA